MDPHLGLLGVWAQGDWVTRGVLLVLLVMSLGTWLVILVKVLDLVRFRRHAGSTEVFWGGTDFAQGLARLGQDPDNPFRRLAEAGRDAALHHRHAQKRLGDTLGISDWVTRCLRNAIDDASAQLQSGLALLASVGSTAPFVGLFGTVWGIYHALMAIGAAGQATIDKVAGPIGEALIMTALGLAVAIPAVLGYHALVRANKSAIASLNRFGHHLHTLLVTGARMGSAPQSDAARPPP